MKTFAVRCIIELQGDSRLSKLHRYEERITLWTASDFDSAIAMAELEAKEYGKEEVGVLGFAQAFELYDTVVSERNGAEVFSLIHESDLAPNDFIDRHFETEE